MERYSKITEKRKREIVLLRGSGCVYKKCAFCDYYHDSCKNEKENFLLNSQVLEKVDGQYGDLEIINSGSVFELDKDTIELIKQTAKAKCIKTLHFESHYLYRNRIPALREEFCDFDLKMKLGLETFDNELRENVLKKGIHEKDCYVIAQNFDEANFLFGIKGQDSNTMLNDIKTGLELFERICINIMCKNTSKILPDKDVINAFIKDIYPLYKNDYRVDILLNNTDFGVGD
ncbi:MAG: radical SAM protein [Clostridia bacterium]|nr:radical SAM protein [Clostridia bacterium]